MNSFLDKLILYFGNSILSLIPGKYRKSESMGDTIILEKARSIRLLGKEDYPDIVLKIGRTSTKVRITISIQDSVSSGVIKTFKNSNKDIVSLSGYFEFILGLPENLKLLLQNGKQKKV